MPLEAPRKPIEVTVTANGFDWREVIAALKERVARLEANQEKGAGCYADGYGASHTADVQLREVSITQFVDESIEWLEQQRVTR
jgi:hypothetical protein